MAHTVKDKDNLLLRVRRIRGQIDAIERALDSEQECSGVLQLMAACRGALNGLMAEVIEGHVWFHVLSPKEDRNSPQAAAAEELIDVVRTYLEVRGRPFRTGPKGVGVMSQQAIKEVRTEASRIANREATVVKTHEEHGEGHEETHALNWRDFSQVMHLLPWLRWRDLVRARPSIPLHNCIIGAVCTLVGGYPIFHEAYENIVQRRMTMELSMAIAILAALAIHETFTALVITLFVLAAEILEGLTVGRGRNAIQRLLDLLPNMATVRRGPRWEDCAIELVRTNDLVLVRPGGRIPVDGVVVSGNSFVDQAAITGESLAVEKLPSAGVYAGTINQSGALEIRVERLGGDTTFGKIIKEVERAEKSRAPIQKTADRLAGYLVYFALGAAALTFLITHNIRSTISVVIVAGACGIAAGTPLAVLGAIGQAAQKGAIIKGGL